MYKKAYGSQLWYCWYFFSRCCPAKLRIDNSGRVTESIGRHNHDPPTCWMTPDGKSYSLPPLPEKGYDVVQCVPTRKGHQILYKGYTYVFKSKLQCGAEQWICSFRQKTGCISVINMQTFGVEVEVPEWVQLYFTASSDKEDVMKCNFCEMEIAGDLKSPDLLEHIKDSHKDIYQVHKDNPEGTVGFRVEFLHLNVLKDDETGDTKMEPVILAAEECEAMESVVVEDSQETQDPDTEVVNMQYVMLDNKRKKSSSGNEDRRRSWIWKYFDKLSNIVYRCNICNVVLSIKGCNTNNLNRHMRSKHHDTFTAEKFGDNENKEREKMVHGLDASYGDKNDEITYITTSSTSGQSDGLSSPSQKLRRSWIWSYFDHVSSTQAQCKLCRRFINHGGNATGNMNRHLKMIHHKTACDNHWVWKVFDRDAPYYLCKICQHRLNKKNTETDMVAIIYHLKKTHGVVSGDQIITGSECSALMET